jgi:hypothetical protein
VGTNLKALVILAFVICIFAFFAVWIIPLIWIVPGPTSTTLWGWRIGLGMGIIATGFILCRADARKEKLPDLLAKTISDFQYEGDYLEGDYFERDGLCFAPVVQVKDGVCWIAMFFQNRYARPCTARVELRKSWIGPKNLPPINADLSCPGGAFGVCRFPYAVPAQCQGRRCWFEVYATTSYPEGKGELLRFHSPRQAGEAAVTTFFTLAPGPNHCRIHLPHGVKADIGAAINPTTEILWQPDLPTNAFPVIQ